jgi:hypothetical protein
MLSGVYWWRQPATWMGVILLRRRHLRIPTFLANQRAFINIKFSENVPGALADATIEFDFYMDHYFGERKAHEEGSSCFLRRRRNGHDCSLRTDTG